MVMAAFFTRFKDIAFQETRTWSVPPDKSIPADEYGFLEFYCDDRQCDCRRVMIGVLGRGSGDKVWATISYGWEKPVFYKKWAGSGLMDIDELSRPTLDPLNPQSPQAEIFLAMFTEMIKDQAYVDRLKRHYEMFRKPAKHWGKLR